MYPKYVLMLLATACACVAGSAPVSAATAAAATVSDPASRPAMMVREPAKAYLAGLALAGRRLVAVGERGVIVLSDDSGKSWRQARVPTSASLTAVQFPSPRQGWAVGHYGVILHSEDGGETWTRQLDGAQAAQLALRDAQAASGQGAAAQRYLADAQRLVQDGPDKPFLGLHFSDEQNGIVVGAYNLAFRTRDGGRSWIPLMGQLDNPRGNHLYAVQAAGTAVYIAGEQGLVLRSTDGGAHFERADTGYKGSFFTVAVPGGDEVVVAGLRGNVYRSGDRGASWRKLDVPAPASITAASVRPGSSLLLANQAGQLLASSPGAQALVPLKTSALPALNDVLVHPDGSIVVATMFGARRLPATAGATNDSSVAK